MFFELPNIFVVLNTSYMAFRVECSNMSINISETLIVPLSAFRLIFMDLLITYFYQLSQL